MAVPTWLDRVWLGMIALSCVIVVPLFTLVWVDRVGWTNVALFLVAMFLIGLYRRLPGGTR